MTDQQPKKSVKIVVLGDIGRSPRMQYHALSLSDNGLKVNIIGYTDSSPLTEVLENPNITITQLHSCNFDKGPRFLQLILKAVWQAISLFLTLLITGSCDYLLCQNPPAVPTLPVCRLYCLVTRTRFIIDWHNYGHTIMALSISPSLKILLKIYTFLEKYFGQSAQYHLCVTYAMKEDLLDNWNINATVLYDRPPHIFHPITLQEKHDWFVKFCQKYPEHFPLHDVGNSVDINITPFTQIVDNDVKLRQDRPGLLFSSTSWTPDEDFGILLEALQVYETTHDLTKSLPKLICVITGKGPMREHYLDLIASKCWQHVTVVTPWLDASDYPTMVASADLGVCLHTSSSGLDLPMKVVDMFGAGLPVCAVSFRCLEELVQHGVNGYIFKTSDELSKLIVGWFEGFPNNDEKNRTAQEMRRELTKFQETRWEGNWNLRAKKFFE
ncbi:chitobiosyldiphosphodolichol beta-mannosyltransferase [Papilio machaon]|uniref:chitobiosyldiphosphodolichol beta-mannosyltransferase n=1 Tax=Papilio machaon TaxID=76193 RepID=UPI001E66524D|nr:chitobiosyldiphosphodolichol beta-mannosyltransferase [Papilio machaon]